MAQSVDDGHTAFVVGQRDYEIKNLPGNTHGFVFKIGRNDSMDSAVGDIFNFSASLRWAGGPPEYREFVGSKARGGIIYDRHGARLTEWTLCVLSWPAKADQNNQLVPYVPISLLVVLDVRQPFKADFVRFHTI